MKLAFALAFCLVVGALAQPKLEFKRCQKNEDCPNGCCQGVGHFLWCNDYSKEGEICSITSRFLCGCAPGLVCKRYGDWFLEKCVKAPTPKPTEPPKPPTKAPTKAPEPSVA